ncbi:MAG: hypothetical protein J6C64_11200 [Lachnospiraceae bacterium]|nr:hypothetical protein [Lachnospiraceae bacterium]
MAVGTGMGTNSGAAEKESALTKEQKIQVAKAKRPMEIANSFRLFFLFVAVILLLFVYFGGKLWTGVAWYDNAVQSIYNFLLWDILLMLLSTFIKFFFAAKYNKVVKHL